MNENALSSTLLADLTAAVGAEHVSTAVSDRLANSRGVWPIELKEARQAGLPLLPACVVWPRDVQQVSAVLRLANEAGVPVIPFGGGSGIVGGTVPVPGCISLDTKRLDGLQVEAISLVAYAQAGLWAKMGQRSSSRRPPASV